MLETHFRELFLQFDKILCQFGGNIFANYDKFLTEIYATEDKKKMAKNMG